ncbi:hypothetical protein PGIGA_G00177210 [Pangasianodon gigas]|uniref:Uncharacterized protein n=1 Tax=Pangasianodon gigas TaxID=30993 RepID=A0ACC5XX46_PANGG|nr:hypothetical protein [Pangasianodon gigas]
MSGGSEWAGQCDVPPEEFPWSEEACEDLWERVEGVRHKLTRILNPAKLTPYLRQCKVIDEQDEDEVLNSTQLPLRISKAGRLLDILRGRGQRGLQAFMESLEFYHPEQYTQLTGQQAMQRCSMMLDEEGHEGLTQFLLLEVRKLREQLRNSRMLRQDSEAGARELGRLKERLLEQAVKYSRALEDQRNASTRERELLSQIEQLKNRLKEAEKSTHGDSAQSASVTRTSGVFVSVCAAPAGQEVLLQSTDSLRQRITGTQALLDILHQDRREAAEQRKELCSTIIRLQGELESAESVREKLEAQCEQLQLKLRTLQLDWEEEQKRSLSYFNQIMDLERERDQALRSRDSLQLEFTDCLLDKNRLRKCITELQGQVEQLHRELEREKDKNHEQEHTHTQCCSHGSPSNGQNSEHSEDSHYNSEENLHGPLHSAKEINRLSTFPFPPHMNSINRRVNTEFDLDSWGSDEAENNTGSDLPDTESSLWDSCSSLQSYFLCPDQVNLPPNTHPQHTLESESTSTSPPSNKSLADDITVVGGNRTGIFVQTVRAGSAAERCGLREGSELIELEEVLFSGGCVDLSQCTAEVAHFTLQWWTEPTSLKHRLNEEGYSCLNSELSSPSFTGADSFYIRVNLDLFLHGEQPCLRVSCNDILHVTDTRYNGKYQWRCTRVDTHSAKSLHNGAVPNYNTAQQLLLVKLRTIALQQQDKKKKFRKKVSERLRLVKAISPKCRGIGSSSSVRYTLSNRHEEHLIPYSLVQPVQVECKRPVIFSPSVLSHGLIERLLQPADSGLHFNTCPPEPIPASEHNNKSVFLLDHTHTSDHTLGIRLQSIQEVIKQDKHCLLQLSVSSVEALLKQGVYPIIIHIKPKDKKGRKFRKLLSCGEESDVMEVVRVEELQLETLPLMFSTLQPSDWSCTDDLIHTVRHTIHSQQGALVWLEMDRI